MYTPQQLLTQYNDEKALSYRPLLAIADLCHEFDEGQELDMLSMGNSIDAPDYIPRGSTTSIKVSYYARINFTIPRE